jgi:hypothetical protein
MTVAFAPRLALLASSTRVSACLQNSDTTARVAGRMTNVTSAPRSVT